MVGTVTDIQRFSIHDGPGIRTTVFLKGCNLRCFWCHNPETLRPAPELQVEQSKCIGCGACVDACPNGAHLLDDGRKAFRRERCRACGACARSCYAGGLTLVGRQVTLDEAAAEVLQDRDFYGRSGGGVTVSGGEPLYQAAFTRALLERCRAAGVHTAVETNLAWPWETVAHVLATADLVMFDLKTLDPDRHIAGTGAPNTRILDNARRLAETGLPFIVRTPVVPGFNDTPEAITSIAGFVARLPGLVAYELLPYHPLGSSKYAGLGLPYAAEGLARPSRDTMRVLAEAARAAGAPVRR